MQRGFVKSVLELAAALTSAGALALSPPASPMARQRRKRPALQRPCTILPAFG